MSSWFVMANEFRANAKILYIYYFKNNLIEYNIVMTYLKAWFLRS